MKFSYIFKKFILIVYGLDDSVCVVHVPKLWRSRSLSPSALQPTLLLCLPLAFTPRCPRSSWMSMSVPQFSPPWTYPAAPMLQIGNYQHSSTVIHSESIHISHYMCFTKHPLWVLLLFIIVFIEYLWFIRHCAKCFQLIISFNHHDILWFYYLHIQMRSLWRGKIMSKINQEVYSRVGYKPKPF